MDLGDYGFRWFTYVPEFNGNRDLPADERISVEIERMRTAEIMAQISQGQDNMDRWMSSEALRPWTEGGEFAPIIREWDDSTKRVFRQFVEHTRAWRNVTLGGNPAGDPVEIFLSTPFGFTSEITMAINAASRLSGQALKNFVRLCDGSQSGLSALDAPTDSTPTDAATPEAQTEPLISAG